MIIHQFYDKGLAHASYAVIRNNKMIVIDPARDPQTYYDFAALHETDIIGIIETHAHADFVSAHLEIHQTTGAIIYCSKLLGATYPHESFDNGDFIHLADIKLKAINTPGHSPDSICILLVDENDYEQVLFTGDTLFVGDVGRPDLRENAGAITATKEELARQMYYSSRDKLMPLPPHITVYPAHDPGSLCGKNISPDLHTTIGRELKENYALQPMSEQEFVTMLNADQPFIPHYFGFDVDLNKKGAAPFVKSVADVAKLNSAKGIENDVLVIDTRPNAIFKNGHQKGAIILQNGDKFETWLGSIIKPGESFYMIAADDETLDILIKKAAKIGYEQNIIAGIVTDEKFDTLSDAIDVDNFRTSTEKHTVVDIRNQAEVNEGKVFETALTIPLSELRDRLDEIPTDKPIVVHCAAGYRSAAGSSIVAAAINSVPVYDLSEAISTLS